MDVDFAGMVKGSPFLRISFLDFPGQGCYLLPAMTCNFRARNLMEANMNTMIKTIKAIYRHGVLEPKEPLTLEEGEEITVTIAPSSPLSEAEKLELLRSTAGGWKDLVDDDLEEYLLELRKLKTRPEVEPWQ